MSAHSENAKRAARGAPEVMCGGKHRFDSLKFAEEIASRSNRRRHHGLSAYKCPVCSGWHVGSHKGRATTKKRNAFKQRKQELE
jgi:hypothetical protein